MVPIDQTPLTLTEILRSVWRQKRFAIAVFALLMLFSLALLFSMPDRYTSQAQLLVRLGPSAVAMDPTADLSHTVSLQESRLHQVNSVMELISSREMIERVAKRVGTERILEPIGAVANFSQSFSSLFPATAVEAEAGYSADAVSELVQLGDACKELQGNLSASVGKKAYTINVRYVSNSPFLAHDVVEAVLAEYPRYHAEAHGSTGSVEFFEKEMDATLTAAKSTQSHLSDLKLKLGIVDLDSEKLTLQGKLADLDRSVNDTDVKLAEVEAELKSLGGELASMPDRIVAEETTGIYKRSGDLVRQGLYELELKEKELSPKYNSDHPKMLAIRNQLEQARLIANSEIGQAPQVRNVANPIRQEIDLLYRQAVAKRAGLKAKRQQVAVQLEVAQSELVALNMACAELNRLAWDADVASDSYMETAKRLANAKQIADLESLELSDVAVAQNASLQLTKTGPLRLYIGAGLCFVMGFVAVFAATLRDSGSTQPRSAQRYRPAVDWDESEAELSIKSSDVEPKFPIANS